MKKYSFKVLNGLPYNFLSANQSTRNDFTSYANILHYAHQGLILGATLCNIFLCDLSFFLSDRDIVGYADNNTLYL